MMEVEMPLKKFYQELQLLYPQDAPFKMRGLHSDVVGNLGLPPYDWVFSGECVRIWHPTYRSGYPLPHLNDFIALFMDRLRNKMFHSKNGWKLQQNEHLLFDEQGLPTPGLLHRLSSRYLDAIFHMQLYCMISQAYMDQRSTGSVSMHSKIRVKTRTRISLYSMGGKGIHLDMGQHDFIELRESYPIVSLGKIFLKPDDMDDFHGLKIFGENSMNELICMIDAILTIPASNSLNHEAMMR